MANNNIHFIDITTLPAAIPRGLYATNNQFLKQGPKGFIQVKVLENDNLYVRVDLPGVPDDAVRCRVDGVRQKVVFFSGETLQDVNAKDDVREYSGTAGLGCDCCVITNVDAKMKDGVLRMIVSRVKVNKDDKNKCTLTLPPYTGKSGSEVEDHPYVVKGRKGALFWRTTEEGGVYITVDIPGVSKDDVIVFGDDSEITCHAETNTINVYEHDESGHLYRAKVINPFFSALPAHFSRNLSWTAEFGVLKICLTNPNTNTNTN